MTTPLEYAGYKDIPGWYLISAKDNLLSPALQRYMISYIGDVLEVVEKIDAGHMSFVVNPAAVADFIMRAARSIDGHD
jgi:pimeloyl-ACP methyl ester carboxylesterase